MTLKEKCELLILECEDNYGHDCTNCPHNGDNSFWCHTYSSADEIPPKELDENLGKMVKIEVDEPNEHDIVNHPNHYTNGGMECIEEMLLVFGRDVVANFCVCNAWKYRYRALYKNQEEDMQKSHWYMRKYKELRGVK